MKEGSYKEVDPGKVHATIERLYRRIQDRFPDASLLEVCGQVREICAQSRDRIEWIQRPNRALRLAVIFLLVLLGIGIVAAISLVSVPHDIYQLQDFVDAIQNVIQDIVYVAITVYFLVRLERLIKRRKVLAALHELRSVAHVIDMHQLTKDPDRILANRQDTQASPEVARSWTSFTLRRYLDYCSELLSLTSKIAALHLKDFDDPAVVAAVNEIEDLTTGLSQKIWQKISGMPDR